MIRKLLLGAVALVVVFAVGLYLWARVVLTEDTVRTALAAQMSQALGQPVAIGSLGSAIFPRLTLNLRDVTIGSPVPIRVKTLHLGTDFRALLSRRIEHARVELSGARIALPLPSFAANTGAAAAPAIPPVEIVSIDAIVLRDVEIVSGGRVLTGDVDIVPDGSGFTVRRVALRADADAIDITGRITDIAGPAADLVVKAGSLNLDRLVAFASDFAAGVAPTNNGATAAPRSPERSGAVAAAPPVNIALTLDAGRATVGTLALDRLTGKARLTSDRLTLDPIAFGVFGGRYDGALVFTLGAVPEFTLNASLSGVDMAAATAFAGSPGSMTGRLAGRLRLAGRGMAAASAIDATRGTARIDIVDGTVRNLGLVRSAVVATSMRADASSAGIGSRDEPFSTLGATLAIAAGSATTSDFRFESKDLLLDAAGTIRLDGRGIDLSGRLQLSDQLSQHAGRDLIRYTQENGRVTLPVSITGTADAPQVRIDVASAGLRAVKNRATEEAQKALKKGLGGLFRR
jgi:uncharacterized protein involved in outer membrane biogenesis